MSPDNAVYFFKWRNVMFNCRNLIVLILFYLLISCGGGGGSGTTNNSSSDSTEQSGIETASEVLYHDFGERRISDYNLIDVANGTYDGIENFNIETVKKSSIEDYLAQLNLDRDPLNGLYFDYYIVIKIKPDCNWDKGPHWIETQISGTEVYFDISYEIDHSLPINGCEISTCEYHIYGFTIEN